MTTLLKYSVYVREKERERESVCVCVRERERERYCEYESVCYDTHLKSTNNPVIFGSPNKNLLCNCRLSTCTVLVL